MKRTLLLAAPLIVACGGAPLEGTASIGSSSAALTASNGRELNGRELNGRELNGRELNGRELNGRELNGRELNGRELNGRELNGRELNSRDAGPGGVVAASLEGSELVLTSRDGETVRGTSVVGVELGNGHRATFRIDDANRSSVPGEEDVWEYVVSRQAKGHRWEPVCGTNDDGTPLKVIALSGIWDYRQGVPGGGDHLDDPSLITFACSDGALAKCVHFGYAPWRTVQTCDGAGNCTDVSLADHHQACTRMVRADYCGDGRSFTQDGMLIDLYDGLSLQTDTETWPFEAEWSADGAVCLSHFRISNQTELHSCPRDLHDDACGDPAHFAQGTLLMTEYSPTNITDAQDGAGGGHRGGHPDHD
jgi:hypothetical protein